jgi:hypothetical protein
MTITWRGESQKGQRPAKCSVRMLLCVSKFHMMWPSVKLSSAAAQNKPKYQIRVLKLEGRW